MLKRTRAFRTYFSRKTLALCLLFFFLMTQLTPYTDALRQSVPNIGTLFWETRSPLADGAWLVSTTLQHLRAGRQEERYIEWTPGATRVVVEGSERLTKTVTPSGLLSRLSSKNIKPIALLNGDYFTLSTGVPMGLYITDGVLRASDNYQNAIVFSEKAVNVPSPSGSSNVRVSTSAAIVNAPLTMNFTKQGDPENKKILIDQINHSRNESRLILFTPDFSTTTCTSTDGIHVVLNTSDTVRVGGTVTATVKEVLRSKTAAPLGPGQMVLSVDARGPVDRVSNLVPGDVITISVSCSDNRVKNASQAIGGYQKLLTKGVVVSGLDNTTAPRTAVGVKPDGSCIFYTVDGRQTGYSTGLGLKDVAERLLNLGCIEAVNLDGGGSTVLGAFYPGQAELTVTGKPSDGSPRSVANYLVLENPLPTWNTADNLFVYPSKATVLLGASVNFSCAATDQNGHRASLPPVSWAVEEPQYPDTFTPVGIPSGSYYRTGLLNLPDHPLYDSYNYMDTNGASVNASGRFTSTRAGTYAVEAYAYGVTGTAEVRVVDAVSNIHIKNKNNGTVLSTPQNVAAGGSLPLTAQAYADNELVMADPTLFGWTVVGNIGTIDNQGNFKASQVEGAAGQIIVSYGDTRTVLPITVGSRPTPVETFEGPSVKLGPATGDLTFTVESDIDHVRFGLKSGRVDYNFAPQVAAFSADATAQPTAEPRSPALTLPASITLPSDAAYLQVWLYGDGSSQSLSATFANGKGENSTVPVTIVSFTGWCQLSLAVPTGAARLLGFTLTQTNASATKGTLWLDQLVASRVKLGAPTAPRIVDFMALASDEGQTLKITATVTGDNRRALLSADIKLTLDGRNQSFSYDAITGTLAATVPLPDLNPHRLTLEAAEVTGARVRESLTWDALDMVSLFTDVPETHWSSPYVNYLGLAGIFRIPDAGNPSTFRPDTLLTRADMALYLARALRVENAHTNYELPFADVAALPLETQNALRALTAMNVTRGRVSKDGKRLFDPNTPITRAEFFTLLGRVLPRGAAVQETPFADRIVIPAYAVGHIDLLCTLKMIDGYTDGTIRPLNNITRAEAAKLLSGLW